MQNIDVLQNYLIDNGEKRDHLRIKTIFSVHNYLTLGLVKHHINNLVEHRPRLRHLPLIVHHYRNLFNKRSVTLISLKELFKPMAFYGILSCSDRIK
jgi:hypothetical protein